MTSSRAHLADRCDAPADGSDVEAAVALAVHPSEVYVDGRWQEGAGKTIDVVNPATGVRIAGQLAADPHTVERAVSAARAAHDRGDWAAAALPERVATLRRVAASLAARADELALGQTLQMGAPITVSRMMVVSCQALIDAYVTGAETIAYRYLRRDGAAQALVRREPAGVVAAITPWNGPLATVINKVVPALLAGCSVVLKPAPETPLEGGIFAEACTAAGVPDGVVNVITGDAATGAALSASEQIDRLSFTGSTAVGRQLGETCGRRCVRASLELGGKSAAIVLPDADLAATVGQLASGGFLNSGQACTALTRVLVSAADHDELVEALSQVASTMVLGDPLQESTQLGPLVSERQRERVERYVSLGREAGARPACGGRRPPALRRGSYYEPTVFAGVRADMRIAREEIFGPVVSVIAYSSEEEAIAIANDSDYDLHGAVFTADPERGLRIAERMRAGSIAVNAFGLSPSTPYGGLGRSGIGREHGREGVEEFLELRSYVVPAELAGRLIADGVPQG